MRDLANKWIVGVCVLSLVAGVAHDMGAKAASRQLATQCIAQPGETLVTTIQTRDGVVCQYASAPPRANWTRRKAS